MIVISSIYIRFFKNIFRSLKFPCSFAWNLCFVFQMHVLNSHVLFLIEIIFMYLFIDRDSYVIY